MKIFWKDKIEIIWHFSLIQFSNHNYFGFEKEVDEMESFPASSIMVTKKANLEGMLKPLRILMTAACSNHKVLSS